MRFETRTTLISLFRAAVILAALGGAYSAYGRFEALADEEEYSLAIAARADGLAAAGNRNTGDFRARGLTLGKAIAERTEVSAANRPALDEIRAVYYGLPQTAEESPAAEPGRKDYARGSAASGAAAISALALGAARRALQARNLLLAKAALAAFTALLFLFAAEMAQHYLLNRRFFKDFRVLKNKLLCAAAPFYPAGEGRTDLEELALAAEALDIALENSMLARIRLARETGLRLARMKVQTRTLALTRRKVITLVEDLEEARLELQREKKALKITSEKLARSNKELEQFAYVASHDLKEPLRIVSSFSGLLSKRYAQTLDGDARDFINYIDQGAQRATELVNALFNYSKVTYTSRDFTRVDCGTALQKALFNLKISIEEKRAVVKSEGLPAVTGDEFQLIQLFQNLVSNALKFNGAPAPEITVSAEERAGEWVLKFADNGIGIPPEHFERIFLIFQRLHTVDKYPGAGIGLALCKKIAENHSGRIWVESTPGAGSAFFVALPATGAAGPVPAESGNGRKKAVS
jgi:signal transduction histidine kinase